MAAGARVDRAKPGDLHRIATFVCLIALGAGARAAETSASGRVDVAVMVEETFATAEDAVAAAAARWNPRSIGEDREFMGAVFTLSAGGFRYSVGAGEPGRDEISVRVRVPAGTRVVALWHTHGAPHFSRGYFSSVDTALANERRLSLYLASPDGKLLLFRPGDATLPASEARRLGLGERSGYARGAVVRPRNAEGVIPVQRLNARWKARASEKPSR